MILIYNEPIVHLLKIDFAKANKHANLWKYGHKVVKMSKSAHLLNKKKIFHHQNYKSNDTSLFIYINLIGSSK